MRNATLLGFALGVGSFSISGCGGRIGPVGAIAESGAQATPVDAGSEDRAAPEDSGGRSADAWVGTSDASDAEADSSTDGSLGGSVGRTIVQLADSTGVGPIAVDAKNVYFGTNFEVESVPISGGMPLSLTTGVPQSGAPLSFALDSSNVYWAGYSPSGAVAAVALGGGATNVLSDGQNYPWGIAVDATSVYWTDYGDGTVRKLPLTGGAAVTLASGQNFPTGIAVDASRVYWANYGDGTIMSVPLAGGAPTQLAAGPLAPTAMAIDSIAIYWTNEASLGQVSRVPLGGGAVTVLATGQDYPTAIATDGVSVYWTASNTGTVMKVAREGGAPVILASGQARPTGIAVDATSVYWGNQGAPSGGTAGLMKITPK